MRFLQILSLATAIAIHIAPASAQIIYYPYLFTTFAGDGMAGSEDGPAPSHDGFLHPEGVAVDGAGNVFVADTGHHVIRRIAPDGTVSAVAGQFGSAGYLDGVSNFARFNLPKEIQVDNMGNVYVADSGNGALRQITPEGNVLTRFAKSTQYNARISAFALGPDRTLYFWGSIDQRYAISPDGAFIQVYFADMYDLGSSSAGITGMAADGDGNLFASIGAAGVILKATRSGIASILAGQPPPPPIIPIKAPVDGPGIYAHFGFPAGLAIDPVGNIFVADAGNNTIRKISPDGLTTTIAGRAGWRTNSIGTTQSPYFNNPRAVAVAKTGQIIVADTGNNLIRSFAPDGTTSTLAGVTGGSDVSVGELSAPQAMAVETDGNILVLDGNAVRRVTRDGTVVTLAGNPITQGSIDGAGDGARFREPAGITVDEFGNIYVADRGNSTIRRINPQGEVTTVAGAAGLAGTTDGPGPLARFRGPAGIAVDRGGTVYVADIDAHNLRKIGVDGSVTTLASASALFDGIGFGNQFGYPSGLAMDNQGTLYYSEAGNHRIRRVSPDGLITTVAGLGGIAGFVDGPASDARFNQPGQLTIDSGGNLFVVDAGNHAIRLISRDGYVSTLAGSPGTTDSTDGPGPAASFAMAAGIAVDADGTLYVADATAHVIKKGVPHFAPVTTGFSFDRSGPAATIAVNAIGLAPLSYQWQLNGLDITGATNTSLPLGTAIRGYSVVVENPYGRITNMAPAAPPPLMPLPTILQEPASLSVNSGGSFSLTVLADGLAPFGYQWTLNGGNIPRATNASYAIFGASSADAGDYRVVIGNEYGSVMSSRATVTVNDGPPIIIKPPIGQLVPPRSQVTLQVVALGRQPFSYQWLKDGARLPGWINGGSTYIIPSFTAANTGLYQVVISNAFGSITSSPPADLELGIAPQNYIFTNLDAGITGPQFNLPAGLAIDSGNNLLVGDEANQRILIIRPGGRVSTLAGETGAAGYADGASNSARFNLPAGVAVDPSGTVLVADSGNFTVRKVTKDGVTTTLAGVAGEAGDRLGIGTGAEFGPIDSIAVDSASNAYVPGFDDIKKVAPNGAVSHFADIGPSWSLLALAMDRSNNLYSASKIDHAIRKTAPDGATVVLAGMAGQSGNADGLGSLARFTRPEGLAVDAAGALYIADTGNGLIRRVSPEGIVTTLTGLRDEPLVVGNTSLVFNEPRGIAIDSDGTLYVTDRSKGIHVGRLAVSPELTIHVSPGGLILTWPLSASDYILESADLLASNDWTPVTFGATIANGAYGLRVNPLDAHKFYRLRHL